MSFRPLVIATTTLAVLALPISVSAQTGANANTDNTRQYEARYFTQFAPRAASDMIGQVPGFSLSEGDSKRGLGQGGANVLINGARLTGKTAARDQLERIAASNVVRIEILDGASLNIPGLSGQVANIITSSTGLTGIWKWEPRFRKNQDPRIAQGEASVSGETGALAYTVSAGINTRREGSDGVEFLSSPEGDLLKDSTVFNNNYSESYTIGTDLVWSPRADHTATLSAEYGASNGNRGETTQSEVAGEGQSSQQYARGEDEQEISIGADYDMPFLAGRLKLIGAHRFEHSPITETSFNREQGVLTSTETKDLLQEEGESILRSEYSWQTRKGHDLQISAEGAYNVLDSDEVLTEIQPAQTLSGQTLARVEEKRAELTLTYGRALTQKLDIQSSVGAEYSELTQTTRGIDESFVREFVRPKGFVSGAYKYDDTLIIRSRIEREVGQLDFGNFIPSVDFQNNFDNAGNPDLVPQQAWLANIEIDKKFNEDTNFQAKIYGALVSDTVDSIPIGVDGNAVGNLDDDAIRYGLELSGSARFDSLGWTGVQADFDLNLRRTEVDDPITGTARPLSNSQEYFWSFNYRHDIPATQWAYGATINRAQSFDNYRVNAIIRTVKTQPRTSLYVEHKDVLGVKVQARLLNLLDEAEERTQTRFDDRRDIGQISSVETSALKGHLFGQLSFSGTF